MMPRDAIVVFRERKVFDAYVEEWRRMKPNRSMAQAELDVETDMFRSLYGLREQSTFQWDDYGVFAVVAGSEFWDRLFVKPVHQPFFQRKISVDRLAA